MVQDVLFWYLVVAGANFAFWTTAGLKAGLDIYVITPWKLGLAVQSLNVPLSIGAQRHELGFRLSRRD